jgi:SAM-dependent methyltransferase
MSLNDENAEFWNELCGTQLAQSIGVTGRTADDLRRFDEAFLDFYPYLVGYLPATALHGTRVLEIGLGYGTLGSLLLERGAAYTGVDISPGPVEMMRYRIALAGRERTSAAERASALHLPFANATFDLVYSIGCLHHTGDLPQAVSEVRRVLRPGGRAIVMVYNGRSIRRIVRGPRRALAVLRKRVDRGAAERARYDVNIEGKTAPHTDFVSAGQLRRLFAAFAAVSIDKRNIAVPRLPEARARLLKAGIDRLVGLDLYVRATA